MKPLSRRKAMTVVAAAPAAVVLGATAEASSDLPSLIEKHRAAYKTFGDAIDDLEAKKAKVRNPEVVVPCFLGGGFSLYAGHEFCEEHILAAYYNQARRLKEMDRIEPKAAQQYREALQEKQAENLTLFNKMWEDSGIAAAEAKQKTADEADWQAFQAICSYRCLTPEEAKLKAEYLLTTSVVRDSWEDETKALLKSLV